MMFAKSLKFLGLFLLLTTLTGCPGKDEDDCFDYGGSTRVDDLITLTPLQTVYNQGDIITFKSIIPSSNIFFGQQINLFEKTNDPVARLVASYSNLFTGNELNFIKGSQSTSNNWFNMPYNYVNGNYELEINIKLNKIGNYILHTDDSVEFQGTSNCNRYRIDTNIIGMNSQGKIEFTVQ